MKMVWERRLVKPLSGIACCLIVGAIITTNSAGQAGEDWTPTKDRTGTCQISVPKNWGQSVTLVRGSGRVRTLDPETQKMYSERMLENTEKLVLYVMKSAPTPGAKPTTTYMASVPGKGFQCTAQLIVQSSYSDNEVKKIVATFIAKAP